MAYMFCVYYNRGFPTSLFFSLQILLSEVKYKEAECQAEYIVSLEPKHDILKNIIAGKYAERRRAD